MPGIMLGKFKKRDIFFGCSIEEYNTLLNGWLELIEIGPGEVTLALYELNSSVDETIENQAFMMMYHVLVLVKNKVSGACIGYAEETNRPSSKNAVCCLCGEKATGRCSGCELVFYCGEEHQLENHIEHKCFCRLSMNYTYGGNIKKWYRMTLECK
jgi:hypothetical protein